MVQIGYPENLYLLWLIPGVLILYIFAFWRKKKLLSGFTGHTLLDMLTSSVSLKKQRLKAYLIALGLSFLILALLNPQFGSRLVKVKRRGIDVLIAIDTSLSMDAEDVKPNRLAKAKLELSSLIDELKGNRVGIIAFAGDTFLQCPLTVDYSAAKLFLSMVDTSLIPSPGTAIGEAIRVAIKSFPERERKYKALILLTDGEDHQSNPLEAAEEAKKEGIRIYTIGIGRPQGEPIPLYDENRNLTGYKLNKRGEVVMSRLDEAALRQIAFKTSGDYYRATTGELEVKRIAGEISGMEKKELGSGIYSQYEDRFQYPLFIALMLLMIEFIISERRRRSILFKFNGYLL
ncbi:MAG: VWA domain-containing protein [bacterium]|nr:VWA domain-containing protein [bacterium]